VQPRLSRRHRKLQISCSRVPSPGGEGKGEGGLCLLLTPITFVRSTSEDRPRKGKPDDWNKEDIKPALTLALSPRRGEPVSGKESQGEGT